MDEEVQLIVKVEKRNRQRGEKRKKKLTFLDGEHGKEIKRIKGQTAEHHECFRCNNQEFTSKNHYLWSTSQGVKLICNACNGNLVAMRPRTPKGTPSATATIAAINGDNEEEEASNTEVELASSIDSIKSKQQKKEKKRKAEKPAEETAPAEQKEEKTKQKNKKQKRKEEGG